jgi:hypothetical protein
VLCELKWLDIGLVAVLCGRRTASGLDVIYLALFSSLALESFLHKLPELLCNAITTSGVDMSIMSNLILGKQGALTWDSRLL